MELVVIGTLPLISFGYAVSTLLTLGIGGFVLYKHPKHKGNILFSLVCLFLAIFDISFLIATNTTDLSLARAVWALNIANIFIVMFYAHWTFTVIGPRQNNRRATQVIYTTGFILFALCMVFFESWMPSVSSKLYLKSFMDAGPLYGVMVAYFVLVSTYAFIRLVQAQRTGNPDERNRLKYFIFAGAFGYITGLTAFPLTWDIPLDPILSMLTATFVIPLAYGIVRAQIMDFKLVVRKAVGYVSIIVVISALLVTLSLLNDWILSQWPGLGSWTIPLTAGTIAFVVGKFYWDKFKESDELKYEFITVAAHKLRTPLTRIKWGLGSLTDGEESFEKRKMLNTLDDATNQLIKIADVLLEAAETSSKEYKYKYDRYDFVELIKEAVKHLANNAKEKSIELRLDIPYMVPLVTLDKERVLSVAEILIENAITYTPTGGTVSVKVGTREDSENVYCEIVDTGIGIEKSEQKHLGQRFYRSSRAIKTDTEGIGLGLYMSDQIITRHGGKMGFSSLGKDKGSTFWFELPKSRS